MSPTVDFDNRTVDLDEEPNTTDVKVYVVEGDRIILPARDLSGQFTNFVRVMDPTWHSSHYRDCSSDTHSSVTSKAYNSKFKVRKRKGQYSFSISDSEGMSDWPDAIGNNGIVVCREIKKVGNK